MLTSPMFRMITAAALFSASLLISSAPAIGQVLPGLPPIRQAPELTFKLPGGQQKTLSQYRGRVIALEFILTTCPHCQVASKVLTKLQGELGPKGFQALDIAVNTTDEAVIKQFITNQQVGFPVGWVDTGSSMNNVMVLMNFMGMTPNDRPQMPQQVLIDRVGMIRYQTPPGSDTAATEEPTLRSRVLELLGQSAAPRSKPATGHGK
jgi:cytochrome oxidase Cu insertion factor (SCO1/SenC/PrrC family)